MKKCKRVSTEIVAPILSIMVFALFIIWMYIPLEKDEKPFSQNLLPGDPVYHDIVSIVEPSPLGGEEFLCRCTDVEGNAFWFIMSYEDYFGPFQELFFVQEGVYYNGQFVYSAASTVRLHGTATTVNRSLQSITGKLLLELDAMELMP